MSAEQKYKSEITSFCTQVKQLRKESGITQIQLKALTGITQSQISLLETAESNPNPGFETLVKLASGFKVHLAQLFASNTKNSGPAFRKKYHSIEKRTNAEKKNFGKRVEELCSHRKLKQDELAILASIDAADLSRYINGETNIEFFSIAKIAEALEVRMFDLFDYEGPLPDNRGFRGKF